MSLTPDRLDHFWHLLNEPRYAHGANLVPIPMPRGAVAELLNDAKEVERLRAKLAEAWDEGFDAPRKCCGLCPRTTCPWGEGRNGPVNPYRTALEDQ